MGWRQMSVQSGQVRLRRDVQLLWDKVCRRRTGPWVSRLRNGLSLSPVKLEQRLANGLSDKPANVAFGSELHFSLGRMDVDVDRCRVNLQKKTAHRVTPFHQRRVITFEQSE